MPATGHIHHPATPPTSTSPSTGTAGPAAADPRWNRWSTAWTTQIKTLTGRTDLTVTVAPGAGRGAPACYIPSLAAVEVDADLIGDPTVTDPRRAGHKKAVPGPYGALVHEAAHAVHSVWSNPPGTAPVLSHVAAMLEESRAELGHRKRRPRDRQWLRACVTTIVAAGDAPTDTTFNAAYAAGLLLARVDTRILKPADVRPLRAAVTRVLGRRTLRRLRTIWQEAHTVADADADSMIDLARRWCLLLGIDPDTEPDMPDPHAATSITVAAAIAAVIDGLGDDPVPPPRRRRPRGGPMAGPTFIVEPENPFSWTTRPPTTGERQAAARLGAALTRAGSREPVAVREDTATPPGRLRTRAAIAAEAQRAAGAVPTALPWQRTVRRPAPTPELAVAVLVDVSGSMGTFAKPLSSAAWILAHGAHRANAVTATLAVGAFVTLVTAPGRRPTDVLELTADAPTERFVHAVTVADDLLQLTRPGRSRLLVVVSDGLFHGDGLDTAQHTIDRVIRAGCAVLWLAPAGQKTHTYRGPTTVSVDEPADCTAIIGRAVTQLLARR